MSSTPGTAHPAGEKCQSARDLWFSLVQTFSSFHRRGGTVIQITINFDEYFQEEIKKTADVEESHFKQNCHN